MRLHPHQPHPVVLPRRDVPLMYTVDPSALVETAEREAARAAAAALHKTRRTVDLTKRYVSRIDPIYSSAMRHIPRVPRFGNSNIQRDDQK